MERIKKRENKPVSVERICKEANLLAEVMPGCQFFIATDEEKLLTKAKSLLRGPVIYCDSYRSLDGTPVFLGSKPYSKAKLGEEVLIEVMLLSRCDKFIHTPSNVSIAVLFFNPELDNKVLHRERKFKKVPKKRG